MRLDQTEHVTWRPETSDVDHVPELVTASVPVFFTKLNLDRDYKNTTVPVTLLTTYEIPRHIRTDPGDPRQPASTSDTVALRTN